MEASTSASPIFSALLTGGYVPFDADTTRGDFMAHCPAHPDANPSLRYTRTPDSAELVHCFAGCAQADVLGAMATRATAQGR